MVDIKKKSLFATLVEEKNIEQEEIQEYTKFLPYVREDDYYAENKHLITDKSSYLYNLNKTFSKKNYENILIQGDSWAAGLNKISTHKYLNESVISLYL